MIIFSWNIQKITAKKAAAYSRVIGQLVNEVAGDQPFVLVVYENKTKPEEVLSAIGTGINARDPKTKWVPVGGGRSVKENILFYAGNGASFDEPQAFTDWHEDFDAKCSQMHAREITTAKARQEQLKQGRPARASTAQGRAEALAKAEKGTYKPAAHFRDPVAITVHAGNSKVSFLASHAPGPSDGKDHEETFAETYAEAVLTNAGAFDMVLGDLNLRTNKVNSGGFVDQSVRLGATTKGAEEGRHTSSRLDRTFGRPGFQITTALVSDSQERDLTDHHCLAIKIDKQPQQKKITAYFPYEPSAVRRQKVIYENRKRALSSRDPTRPHGEDEDDLAELTRPTKRARVELTPSDPMDVDG